MNVFWGNLNIFPTSITKILFNRLTKNYKFDLQELINLFVFSLISLKGFPIRRGMYNLHIEFWIVILNNIQDFKILPSEKFIKKKSSIELHIVSSNLNDLSVEKYIFRMRKVYFFCLFTFYVLTIIINYNWMEVLHEVIQ